MFLWILRAAIKLTEMKLVFVLQQLKGQKSDIFITISGWNTNKSHKLCVTLSWHLKQLLSFHCVDYYDSACPTIQSDTLDWSVITGAACHSQLITYWADTSQFHDQDMTAPAGCLRSVLIKHKPGFHLKQSRNIETLSKERNLPPEKMKWRLLRCCNRLQSAMDKQTA